MVVHFNVRFCLESKTKGFPRWPSAEKCLTGNIWSPNWFKEHKTLKKPKSLIGIFMFCFVKKLKINENHCKTLLPSQIYLAPTQMLFCYFAKQMLLSINKCRFSGIKIICFEVLFSYKKNEINRLIAHNGSDIMEVLIKVWKKFPFHQ